MYAHIVPDDIEVTPWVGDTPGESLGRIYLCDDKGCWFDILFYPASDDEIEWEHNVRDALDGYAITDPLISDPDGIFRVQLTAK